MNNRLRFFLLRNTMSSRKRKREQQKQSMLLEPRSSASYSIVFETKRQKKQQEEDDEQTKWDEYYLQHRIRDTVQTILNVPSVLTEMIMQYVAVPLVYASQGILYPDQHYQLSLRCRPNTSDVVEEIFATRLSDALLQHTWDMHLDIGMNATYTWVHPVMLFHERSRFVWDVLLYGKNLDTLSFATDIQSGIVYNQRTAATRRKLVSSTLLAESIAIEMQDLIESVAVSSVTKEWMVTRWLYCFGAAHGDKRRHVYERGVSQPLSKQNLFLSPNTYDPTHDTFHLRCLLSDVVDQYEKAQEKESKWDTDACEGYQSHVLCTCPQCEQSNHQFCDSMADFGASDNDEDEEDDDDDEDQIAERTCFRTCLFMRKCTCPCTNCIAAAANANMHNCELVRNIAHGGKYAFCPQLCWKPQVHSHDDILASLSSTSARNQLSLSMALVPMEQQQQKQQQPQQSMALIVAPSTALVPYRY